MFELEGADFFEDAADFFAGGEVEDFHDVLAADELFGHEFEFGDFVAVELEEFFVH